MSIKISPAIFAIIILPVILLFTSSCDKKEDTNYKPVSRVKQIISEYVGLPPLFTLYKDTLHFEYNDHNQLTAISNYKIQEFYTFKYNQDGTISEAKFISDEETDVTTFFEWTGNSVTMNEIDNVQNKKVFELNSDGQIERIETYSLYLEEWIAVNYTINSWVEGNLISSEKWESDYAHSSGKSVERCKLIPYEPIKDSHTIEALHIGAKKDLLFLYKEQYTYDNMKNPFKDIQVFQFIKGSSYNSKNNIHSAAYFYFDSDGIIYYSQKAEYTYSYNRDSYPTIKSEPVPIQGYKIRYVYE